MVEQRSDEWFAMRAGKVTASRVADVIAKTKTGPAVSRKNYMAELIAERLSGEASSGFTNAAMQWGTDTEPMARDAYQAITMETVTEEGFVIHPTIEQSGASPDGLVGEDGLIEIKCPNTATHLDTLESGKVPAKYITQMQWQMACTGRQWCDFMSFDPRLPEAMQAFIKRVPRNDEMIAELEAAVTEFLAELDKRVADLKAKYGKAEK